MYYAKLRFTSVFKISEHCTTDEKYEGTSATLENSQFRTVLYPKGRTNRNKGHVSLYIISSLREFNIDFEFTVLNQLGLRRCHASGSFTIAATNQIDGIDRMMPSTKLFSPVEGYCVDGRVLVAIYMKVGFPKPRALLDVLPPVRPRLNSDITDEKRIKASFIRNQSKFSARDVTVLPGGLGKYFLASAEVLGQHSSVLQEELQQGNSSVTSRFVDMTSFDAVAVTVFLDFLYSREVSTADLMCHAADLLQIASKYKVHALIDVCSNRLASDLNFHNVICTLKLADECNSQILKDAALHFIVKHMDHFALSDSFAARVGGELIQEIMKYQHETHEKQSQSVTVNESGDTNVCIVAKPETDNVATVGPESSHS